MTARVLLIITLLLALTGLGQAQDSPQERLRRASEAFGKGRYSQAADLYQELLHQGYDDFQIHYNLGLALQTLNRKGEARAHYERARLMKPWDSDVAQNLSRLRATLDDNEPETPALRQAALLFSGWSLFTLLTLSQTAFWYIAWKYRQGQRELHLWGTLASLALALVCLGLLWVRSHVPAQAAVIPASVVLKNGPGREFTESLSVHAGVLVDVIRREGDWTEVEALGNVRAWIPESDLARVDG